MKHLVLFLFFNILLSSSIQAQPCYRNVDSLKALLSSENQEMKIQIKALNNLSNIYFKKDSLSLSMEYARRQLVLSKDFGEEKWLGNSYINIARVYDSQNVHDKAFEYLSKAYSIFKKEDNTERIVYILDRKASIYGDLMEFDKAVDSYKMMLEECKKFDEEKHKKFTCWGLNMIGKVYYSSNSFDVAAEYFYKLLKFAEEKKDSSQMSYALLNIGLSYKGYKDYKKAAEFNDRALEIIVKLNDDALLANAYNNIAVIYREQGDFELAAEYMEKAHEKVDKDNERGVSAILNNLAIVYRNYKKYNKAIEYHNRSLEQIKKVNDFQKIIEIKYSLAETYENMGDYKSALLYYNQSLNQSIKHNYLKYVSKNYKSIYDLYNKNGKYKKAHEYMHLYISVKDSMIEIEKEVEKKFIEKKYKTMQKIDLLQKKNKIKDGEIKRQKMVVIFVVLLALMFSVLLFVWTYFKRKATKNEKQKIQEKIGHKEKEIATSAFFIANKNNIIKSIKRDIENVIPDIKSMKAKQSLRDINRVINQNLNLENDWITFKMNFEQRFPTFFSKLKADFPDITKGELKLCACIKMEYSTIDIAKLLNLAINSVKSSKRRLRKKVGLASDTFLNEFISKYE